MENCRAESNQHEFATISLQPSTTSPTNASSNKRWKYLTTGSHIHIHLERLRLPHASALQMAMTTCRHTPTAFVSPRMGSAHYFRSPI
ncbi:hypothetical protein CDAR_463851 [Caerostris darwini]|uniref:Uncharacterized protein n=1 Tax=Caerostris darwini TaxID=1538125 RepID=A0AAV4RYN7_9ARAC|nr:hypothetical protein CDAR_463851 [Caerostris darwini]